MPTDQELAEKAVAESARIPDFMYFGDLPIGETWAFTFSKHRDSTIIDESNWDAIRELLIEKFPDDTEIVHSSHWAVGWIDQPAVRMLDDAGRITPAGAEAIRILEQMKDYPLLDEDDYSQREFDKSIENIKWAHGLNAPEAKAVYGWLSHNNQSEVESVDDGGAYPSEAAVAEALKALKPKRSRKLASGQQVLQ